MSLAICIPTYNSEDFIERTIESICNQTQLPDAIILVDNGSTDNTVQRALDTFKRLGEFIDLSKVKMDPWSRKENIGRIQNWNFCLKIFMDFNNYKFLKFVFAGDTLEPKCLGIQCERLSRTVKLVTSAHRIFADNGQSWEMNHVEQDAILVPEQSLKRAYKSGNWIAGSTACPLIARDILRDIKFREDMDWAADWMFWTQLSERTNIGFVNKTLVNFHMDSRKGYNRMINTSQALREEKMVRNYIKEKLL